MELRGSIRLVHVRWQEECEYPPPGQLLALTVMSLDVLACTSVI